MARLRSEETPDKRSLLVKIGVIVAALTAAGYFAWRAGSGASDQLDTPESAVPYVCLNCAATLSMTPADYDRAINTPRPPPPAGSEEPMRGRSSGVYCEKCGQRTLVLGTRCPKDGTVVAKRGKDGRSGKCAKCGWQAGS